MNVWRYFPLCHVFSADMVYNMAGVFREYIWVENLPGILERIGISIDFEWPFERAPKARPAGEVNKYYNLE